ncbi:MAG: 4-hydroxythreonine-4-phosphate dehydrogenase PdxA [Rhodospirillales bacterium]|nr:4-hydroxythreonine-4-phosphate dehydrogenase PdxA [Rhodospirillales bacterium]
MPLALTMGEPAGIGGDIALQAWLRRAEGVPRFFVIDDPARLESLAARQGWPIPVRAIAAPSEAEKVFADALPVLPLALPQPVEPGQPSGANAPAVRASIERAVALVRAGEAKAMVTNPINKQVMYQGGFAFPGHTEFLAALAGNVPVAMMLACSELRVVPVTIHLSLSQAIARLTREEIVACGRITAAGLQRYFGIARPRLAVAALNPHAGESGSMGREEIEIIAPAVADLQALGIDAFGPAPSDTLFHARARGGYDAALCMTHDHALIPLKTIDFDRGVNITLGLPFIRTSPDHGTAMDIAGTGKANAESLVAALKTAAEMAANRHD